MRLRERPLHDFKCVESKLDIGHGYLLSSSVDKLARFFGAGLEGFRRKLESDLEYVEGKLDAIQHVRNELEEHMRRLTEVLQGLNNKTEAERRALDRLTDDFNQLKAEREAQVCHS